MQQKVDSNESVIVLSLFDGMSCGRLALDMIGVNVSKYYASEFDKFAIAESKANFPDHIHLGDVTKWREWDIDWASVDLVMGGSPCQGFSSAGKKGGTKATLNGETIIVTDRETYLDLKEKGAKFLSSSHLFWEYVLIIDHIKTVNPNVNFLLENVKMNQVYLNMISETLGLQPRLINSALVSAQNRWRWYWCSWETTQPEDRGILLRDILEDYPTDPTLMSDKFIARQTGRPCLVDDFDKKAKTLSAMEYIKNGRQGDYVRCGAIRGRPNSAGENIQQLEQRKDDKTNSLTTVQKDNVVVYPAAIVGRRLNPETGKRDDYNKDLPITQCLQVKHNPDKMGCLTTIYKDTVVSYLPPGRYPDIYNLADNDRCKGITENEDGYRPHRGDERKSGLSEVGRILKPTAGKTGTITTGYAPMLAVRATVQANAEHTYNEKTPTLTASMGMGGGNVPLISDAETADKFKGKYIDKNDRLYYRKLTVVECCRLQTVPDDYFKVSSKSQAYKMLGNGWTVAVIAHLLGDLFHG
ncbi:DNA cytosine methyltransferase [Photobacterium damselae]|uniref:DNA cytosine methyltransferase n=1 Tax=Photobacterium damselae TaxID=38293 RepID=UPI001EEEB02E|nr:DNA cytosine methyltransferase [Photobacterium damselae]UKA12960.1 DNA cytosine methyltransferase [Photobacterium damselae subsp. damselae]